jgi:hypothetical protein
VPLGDGSRSSTFRNTTAVRANPAGPSSRPRCTAPIPPLASGSLRTYRPAMRSAPGTRAAYSERLGGQLWPPGGFYARPLRFRRTVTKPKAHRFASVRTGRRSSCTQDLSRSCSCPAGCWPFATRADPDVGAAYTAIGRTRLILWPRAPGCRSPTLRAKRSPPNSVIRLLR